MRENVKLVSLLLILVLLVAACAPTPEVVEKEVVVEKPVVETVVVEKEVEVVVTPTPEPGVELTERMPERDEFTAIIGPVFMYYLERYFLDVPDKTETDEVIASILDESPESHMLLRRALDNYKTIPEGTKHLLFDGEMLRLTASATNELNFDVISDRINQVGPSLLLEPMWTGSTEPPTAPSALVAKNSTSKDPEFRTYKIKLSWQDNSSDEDGFLIYRTNYYTLAGTPFQLISKVGPNVTTYDDVLSAPKNKDDQYCYQVVAFKISPIAPVGQVPIPIESSVSNIACSYYDPSHHPPLPDFDKDGVPDEHDDCPGMPGNVLGCPDGDKDGVADPFDPCPFEWGEDPNSYDTGPVPPNGCPIKYKLTWLGMEVLNNSVAFTDPYGKTFYNETKDPFDEIYTGPGWYNIGNPEEPYLLFTLVNGQTAYGKARTWTMRWSSGERVWLGPKCAGWCPDPWPHNKFEPDDDVGGEENKQGLKDLQTRGLTVFGELDKFAIIDSATDFSMAVTLMERDWTNLQCFQNQVDLWKAAVDVGSAIGGSFGACAGTFGLGCGLAIGKAIKSVIETLFSLDPDPICINVKDPDDYMGTDYWYMTRKEAQIKTLKNGAYAFSFDMPTEPIKITTGWYSNKGPLWKTATMRARLYFCLYREGIPDSQVKKVCSPWNKVSVVY